jgi:hypothetical protein
MLNIWLRYGRGVGKKLKITLGRNTPMPLYMSYVRRDAILRATWWHMPRGVIALSCEVALGTTQSPATASVAISKHDDGTKQMRSVVLSFTGIAGPKSEQ